MKKLVLVCSSVCLFLFSFNSFAQTPTDFLILAEKARNGTTEEKRDILFQIRNIRTEQASRLAVPALKDDAEIVRATAASSIIFLPSNEAAQLLLPLLRDKSAFVRREAAFALGKIKNPQAANALLQVLEKDKELEVRVAAANALGKIGDVNVVAVLTKLLQVKPKESQTFLRRSAARSIGQIAQFIQNREIQKVTPEDFLPEKYLEIQKPLYESLTESFPIFKNANSTLIKILQNSKESQDAKREAAFALGAIADKSSISILENNLNSDDVYLTEIAKNALLRIKAQKNFIDSNKFTK